MDSRCRLERNDDVWTNHSSVHSTQGVNQILCQLTRNRRRVQVVTTCGSVVNFFKFSFLRIQGLTRLTRSPVTGLTVRYLCAHEVPGLSPLHLPVCSVEHTFWHEKRNEKSAPLGSMNSRSGDRQLLGNINLGNRLFSTGQHSKLEAASEVHHMEGIIFFLYLTHSLHILTIHLF